MSKSTVTIGVVAAALALGAAIWQFSRDATIASGAPGEVVAGAGVDRPATTDLTAPAVDLAPPSDAGNPTSERTAVPEKETLAGPSFLLLDQEARPVFEAQVVLCREGDVLASGETDDTGSFTATVEAEGSARLLVVASGWTPQIHDVPLTAERHEVRLWPGAIVSGLIVVEGHRPAEPIPLLLRSDRTLLDVEKELGITFEEGGIGRLPSIAMRTRTAADGSFSFQGLAEDWSGTIELPLDYRLQDQTLATSDLCPGHMRLERPEQGLRIEVVKRLLLTGRIIDFPKRIPTPVPLASVQPEIEYSDSVPSQAYQGFELADDHGRFSIALRSTSIQGGTLWISSPDHGHQRGIDLEPRDLREDWDLGDLALFDRDDTQTMRMVVLDTEGNPIAEAVAGTSMTSPISAPTDDEGGTSLRGVVPGLTTIVVYRVGYEVTTALAPAELSEEIEIVMRRSALLEIRFLTPERDTARGVIARLAADRHPLRDERERPQSRNAYKQSGATSFLKGYTTDGTKVIRLRARGTDSVLINDIEPGLPLRLRVEGFFGETLQERDIAPLQPEEHRQVDIVLDRVARTLRGRVLDEAGLPLPMASAAVILRSPDRSPGSTGMTGERVDEDGSFRIEDIYASHIHLHISAEGYVPIEESEFEVPQDEEPVEFRLSPSRTVTVIVEDEVGARLPALVSAALPTGATVWGSDAVGESGAYILRGLPEEQVTIGARVHMVWHTEKHDPLIPRLTITVPVLGEVEVTVHRFGNIEFDKNCGLWILPTDGSELTARYVTLRPEFSNPVRIPGVLPGHYVAVVRRNLGDYSKDAPFEELSARIPIVVLSDETMRFEIWP